MVCVLDGLDEFLDRIGQQLGVVGYVHLFGDLRLGALGHVQDTWLALDRRPLEFLLAAVLVDALAVLAGDVVEETPNVCRKFVVLDLDVTVLDSEFAAVFCAMSSRTVPSAPM